MEYLYAPWRKQYVQSVHGESKNTDSNTCVFCTQIASNQDEQHLVLARFEHAVVMLNLYPYNSGHLLVIPHAHVEQLDQLSAPTRIQLMELTNALCTLLRSQQKAHGINVGLNLGKAAGAGIPQHLHMHVLPRWIGDTNFLPLLAQTKQISVDLRELYAQLKPLVQAIKL
ncbi:MAG: HIT domain-containing protein [Candidatus Babeliales bacterium]